MKKVIHTESGSRYLIDYDSRTWKRFKGKEANDLRSEDGQFIDIGPLEIGQRLAMLCPAFQVHDEVDGRAIISSPIISIEDVPEC